VTSKRTISASRFDYTRRTSLLGMVACLVLLVGILAAKDGRDFAGFYEVVDTLDLGGEVRVTLRFRIFNYSDADVQGAVITLEDSSLLPTSYGSFDFISIEQQSSVRLEKDFFIPHSEYDLWQSGATPRLSVQYTDAETNTVHRSVELAPMVVGGEE
jgi:hypothetical protein